MLTIIICIIHSIVLFLYTIPGICLYVNQRYFTQNLDKFLFTYYQICRLQYCFNQLWHKSIFIILYTIGIIYLIGEWSMRIISYRVIDLQSNGCGMKRDENGVVSVVVLWIIGIFSFYIWDVLVLSMYVCKIKSLQREKQKRKHSDIGHDPHDHDLPIDHKTKSDKRVDALLRKTLILTIILEIFGFSTFVIKILLQQFIDKDNSDAYILTVEAMDTIITCFIMYLLVEHNHKFYAKLMKYLSGISLLCCCKSMVYDTIRESQNKISDTSGSNISGTTMEDGKTNTMTNRNTMTKDIELVMESTKEAKEATWKPETVPKEHQEKCKETSIELD